MKTKFLKAKHWMLALLLGLLGVNVSSCEKMYGCPEDEITPMYGVPSTEYNDSLVDKP